MYSIIFKIRWNGWERERCTQRTLFEILLNQNQNQIVFTIIDLWNILSVGNVRVSKFIFSIKFYKFFNQISEAIFYPGIELFRSESQIEEYNFSLFIRFRTFLNYLDQKMKTALFEGGRGRCSVDRYLVTGTFPPGSFPPGRFPP